MKRRAGLQMDSRVQQSYLDATTVYSLVLFVYMEKCYSKEQGHILWVCNRNRLKYINA